MDGSGEVTPKGRKRQQVIEGAREIFLRDGFEGASVDEIARASRVSKATLYSYFPDKRMMFLEVAMAECLKQEDVALCVVGRSQSIRGALLETGRKLVTFLTSAPGQSVSRTCIAESDRFPELGRHFYENGPMLVRRRIIELLEQAVARGEVCIHDLELAAEQFAGLCKVDLVPRTIFGIPGPSGPAEIDRIVHAAVEMFMARYGTEAPAGAAEPRDADPSPRR